MSIVLVLGTRPELIKRASHAQQTSAVMTEVDRLLKLESPSTLLERNGNTVLDASLTAAKLKILVGHVEAGLRFFDMRKPEEHNRRLTDRLSGLLFAPTEPECPQRSSESEGGWAHVDS